MREIRLNTKLGITKVFVSERMDNLHEYCDPGKTILLVDENVLKHYHSGLSQFKIISVPQGEKSKSLESYSSVFGKMLDAGVDRTWKLVGIGGGITTDLSGFVASSYFRGIDFGFVSTTLLGQVDAAIGGKNGINYMGYKNLIGVIRQPGFVINDVGSLKTLPKNEFLDGFSEIIKYGFIRNPLIYEYLDDKHQLAMEGDEKVLEKLVFESVKVKVEIVEADVSELGERKLLNFGHTFAHAIEKLSSLSHGSAVSVGMVMAARLSVNLGFCKSSHYDKLVTILLKTGLPVSSDIDAADLMEVMKKDKKKAGDIIQFILISDIGKAFVHNIKIADLKSVLNDLH